MVTHREFLSASKRVYTPDIGTDGRIENQIRALGVQTILESACGATAENIASLYIFPEKWKQHVAEVPTSHREFTDNG